MTSICHRATGLGLTLSSRLLASYSIPSPNTRISRNDRLLLRTFFRFPFSSSSSSSSSSSTIFYRMETTARVSTLSSGGGDGVIRFPLSPTSALVIQKGDITKWSVDGSSDAIVNPANERMLGGGGADGAIHRAAGPDLLQACYNVPEIRPGVRCPTGEARITPGFNLAAAHVIHTVGPIYNVESNPAASLGSAYRNSLRVAKEKNLQYIAFPAISCGIYGYPFDEAVTVAITTIKEFQNDFKEVHFVLFSTDIYDIWLNKANELLKD
ncbi:Appr-1-p processing enzyme family protein isoform 1 [Quillaja saponaria]|uniref:Appr-1-p processing enzyme family protein isoform 1 n=1 Tax=Quillaja saponaria TaxID=32244 RepID=A0AAD7LKI6_QUISA|nr:Appr-1-p processing enzyme family protein isoform 1 [Quillaja saponaria]